MFRSIFVFLCMLLFFFCTNLPSSKLTSQTLQPTQTVSQDQQLRQNYNEIKINSLTVIKVKDQFPDREMWGVRFEINYTLPDTIFAGSDPKLGIGLAYPDDYRRLLLPSGSGYENIPPNTSGQRSGTSIHEFYSDGVTSTQIDALLKKQLTFQVQLYSGDQIIRTVDIENTVP